MALNDILDFVLGGRRSDNNSASVDDTRLLSLTDDNSLTFQAPDLSAQSQLASSVSKRLGNTAPRNLTTRKSTLELSDEQITRGANGQLEIDFSQFGGKQFKGTMDELSQLQGTELMNVIGAGAVDTASGNTLPNNVVQGSGLSRGNGVTKTSVTNSLVPKVGTVSDANSDASATTKPTSFLELSDLDGSFDKDLSAQLDSLLPDKERQSLLDTILAKASKSVSDSRGSNN